MKRFNHIYILLIGLICFSCQNDTNLESEADIFNSLSDQNSVTTTSKSISIIDLETEMHWVSFMIAKTVSDNSEAEQVLIDELNSSHNNAISITLLLDDRLGNNTFEEAFRQTYMHFYSNPFSTCRGSDGKPNTNYPVQTSNPGHQLFYIPMVGKKVTYEDFIKFITEDHCLEINLPNGYSTNRGLAYTTAHPLTNDLENIAFRYPEDCGNRNIVQPFTLRGFDNLIITRPYTGTPYRGAPTDCTYPEYDVADFTSFLSY